MKPDNQNDGEKSAQRNERVKRKDFHSHPKGAKTFRRGRAIAFLERMEQKRSTLKKQLETPELQSINTILLGELKATESIIDEFVLMFELLEFSEASKESSKLEEESKNKNTFLKLRG